MQHTGRTRAHVCGPSTGTNEGGDISPARPAGPNAALDAHFRTTVDQVISAAWSDVLVKSRIVEEFMAEKTVDEYIATLDGWKAEVVSRVRVIIKEAAPEAQEKYRWAQPVYEVNGPLCYMKAFKNSVNFGFWRGVDLDDPLELLQGSGKKMRHVSLSGMDDINETAFFDFVQQAVRLNLEVGDPTKG